MRILHATGYYFPESTGGTEIYVDGLARELSALGCESTVLAPSRDLTESGYDWRGVPVRRFPWSHGGRREIISGLEPHPGFDRFEEILAASGASIYHQHAWSGGCGARHLRSAKEHGMSTVVTVHIPGFSCLSGTMMREGAAPCPGRIDALDCGVCWGVVRKGLPAALARPALQFLLGAGLASRANAAFDAHRRHFDTLLECSDRIVAVCDWLRDALLLNGVRPDQIVSCRQGIDRRPDRGAPRAARRAGEALRVGFLGRFDPVKGLHVLVEAFRGLPGEGRASLDVHGIANDADGRAYERRVRALAGGDERIRFLAPVPGEEVFAALGRLDALAVPSQWLETGPLVVMESLAAGTPVLGSRLGGIAELVHPGIDGWLVAHDDVDAWRGALRAIWAQDAPPSAAAPGGAVRTMRDVAGEMKRVYAQLPGAGGA